MTNHVLSGALIGATVSRPSAAFTLGVLSHFALDTVPHWGDWESKHHFMSVAVPDGLTGVAAIAVFAAASPPGRRLAVLAGMAGAALPDLDKPSVIWFGRSPFPATVDRFHASIQHEAQHRAGREFATAAVLGVVALTMLRRGRPATDFSWGMIATVRGRPAAVGRARTTCARRRRTWCRPAESPSAL